MLVWFVVLAIGGLVHLIDDPRVFQALNPALGVQFILTHGVIGLAVMGLVFLVATGAEALYADLGHFGRKPIQFAWLAIVQPALILNYFGQGALLLANPEAIENPFYRLYPAWALIPMVVLATVATVIASQAVITGAFSFTRQAIQLGLLPRLEIRHTSESIAGQIYLPRVNQLLFVGVLLVTLIFRSSSDLAAAYGLSVTATMVIDSLMAFFVVWRCWGWQVWKVAALMVPLLLIEQAFLAANIMKIPEGGWLPLLVAAMISLMVLTWVRGSRSLAKATRKNEAELEWLVRKLDAKPPHRVPGTAVFLTGDPTSAPTSLMHNLKHNRVLHERNIILTIKTEDTPRVQRHERIVDRPGRRHLHPRGRTLRLHGDAERAQDPRALPAQGPQHRHCLHLVLPVAALAQDHLEIGDAALAGAAVHLARRTGRGRDRIFPHPQRPRGRGGHASDGLTGSVTWPATLPDRRGHSSLQTPWLNPGIHANLSPGICPVDC